MKSITNVVKIKPLRTKPLPRVIKEIIKNRWLYAMALPGFVFVFIFSYLPLQAHVIAFKEFSPVKGIWKSPWVGLENIKFFFQGSDWLNVTKNTLVLNLIFIITGTIFALAIAIGLNEITSKWFKKLSQTFLVLPHLISYMVVSLIITQLFAADNGMINNLIQKFGGTPQAWFSKGALWPYILSVIVLWKGAGWTSIIYLATITGISEEIYESARIDGASRMQQIWYITLPQLKPTIIILTLLALGKIFYGDFGLIYTIIGDNPMLLHNTDVIDTFTYRALRQAGNYSMASAVALFQSTMGFICILFFNWLTGKVDSEYKLF